MIALVKEAAHCGVKDILIHAITDGRDTSPTGGAEYLSTVRMPWLTSGAVISTVIGRYFAMDRDKRWERTKLAWDAIVLGKGENRSRSRRRTPSGSGIEKGETDEFLQAVDFFASEPATDSGWRRGFLFQFSRGSRKTAVAGVSFR